MERPGFPSAWIQGISALYKTASSRVIIGGRMGERFHLERSMKQGCPLAPYLFLFFAEAMAHFLHARTIGIRGIQLPIRDDCKLLDSESADNTALYVHHDEITDLDSRVQASKVDTGEASRPGGGSLEPAVEDAIAARQACDYGVVQVENDEEDQVYAVE